MFCFMFCFVSMLGCLVLHYTSTTSTYASLHLQLRWAMHDIIKDYVYGRETQ